MLVASQCPDSDELRRLVLGRLPEDLAEALEQHVEQCERCSRLLPGISADDELVEAMRARATIVLEPSDAHTVQDLIPRLQMMCFVGCGDREDELPVAKSAPTRLDLAALFNPPQSADEMGRLGPYRVLKLLGHGGMGAVFLAEDPHLQRSVALKVMLPEVAQKALAKDRFLREARATAKIEHDHIVTIYQVGEDRGAPFVAMQLLRGESLDGLLKRHDSSDAPAPLDLSTILRLGREIATGLAAAHQRGLIHRDIKPGNIWLDSGAAGRVKILDFGLAQPSVPDELSAQRGTIAGTAAYMAPEQAWGEPIDARADLFSLGCLLYRLCAGRLPWKASDAVGALVAAATERPTPVQEVSPGLPPKLADTIMKLLAKKPADRPASAQAVVDALSEIEQELASDQGAASQVATLASQRQAVAEAPARRRANKIWAILAGLAGVFALAAVMYVETDAGTLRIEALDENVQISIKQNGKLIEVLDTKQGTKVRLQAGQYELGVQEKSADIQLDRDRIEISRGGVVVVKISRVKTPENVQAANALVNSLGMKLVFIPAGKFQMGSPPSEVEHKDDERQHEVIITRPFYMDAHCVTVGQFRAFVQQAAVTPEAGDAWLAADSGQTEDFPVGNVTWNDAVAFCAWLSKKEGRIYRLPTEAEWEYACRAGAQTAYFFGDDPLQLLQYANAQGKSRPMGRLRSNPWGLYDMYGNQWQWTADWYGAEYYQHSPLEDPRGPDSGTNRVMRGGSFAMAAGFCRSAYRHGIHGPAWHKPHVGFRVLTETSAN